MSTLLLDENSPKILQPSDLKIRLKEHQLTSIYAMNKLEQTGKIEQTIKSCIYKFQVCALDNPYSSYYWLPDSARNYKNINR